MFKILALGLSAVVLAKEDPFWMKFVAYKARFELLFDSQEEDSYRFNVYKSNMEKAKDLNMKAQGKATFGETKFSHVTKDEFKKSHLGYKPTKNGRRLLKSVFKKKNSLKGLSADKMNQLTEASIDWRDVGCVTPVKDQGQCGSCWAFSATQAAETGYCLHTGDLKVLSPQQVASCDGVDLGCNGGDTSSAYEYMREAGGLETEKAYPYTSGVTERTGACKANPSKFKVKVGESSVIASDASDETNMLGEIKNSPMSICVDAESWQLYFGGVVDSSTCGTELDHCVHLVGYKGGSGDDGNYWIVKNSWASSWGNDGYIYVRQGENACGIAEEATIVDATWEDVTKDGKEVYI